MIKVIDRLQYSNLPHSRITAKWIFCHVLDCSATYLIAHEDLLLNTKQISTILEMTERCANHEPVQYVIGYTEFCGLMIDLSPNVMIPRPETEHLVELSLKALKSIDTLSVLDIGTGSGCIALAMKHFLPKANVTACDISVEALSVAKGNSENLGLQLNFVHADIFSSNFLTNVETAYDLVISNPPYIPDHESSGLPKMVRDFEPPQALFCGDDPMSYYQAINDHLDDELLKEGGIIALETHSDYAVTVSDLFEKRQEYHVEMKYDLNEMPRFVIATRRPRNSSQA